MANNNKISIEQSNPFAELDFATSSIENICKINTTIEFKSDKGVIVALPDGDSSLLMGLDTDDNSNYMIGDCINVYADAEGYACKVNEKYEIYKSVISKAKNGRVFSGKVIDATKQGLLVDIDGLQAFMPEGQIGLEVNDNFESYIGRCVDVKLISVKLKEKEGNRFLPVVSHKALVDEKIVESSQKKLDELKVGDKVSGIVKKIEKYGVFVSIFPFVDGLIHITDLSWKRFSNPAEIVTVGDHINIVVLEKRQMKDGKVRISLGLKQLEQKPWESFEKNSKEGDLVSGTICNITDYGIFIMLPCGVQGFVHKTELSWNTEITPKLFQKGDLIISKIISIDWGKEKLLLSIKRTQQDPLENHQIGEVVNAVVVETVKKGIRLRLENDDLPAFIPMQSLLYGDSFAAGTILKCVIKEINHDKRKIIVAIM